MSKWLAENMPVMTGLVTAMVALFGIILTTVSLIMTGRQNKAHRAAMKEDREAAKLQFEAQREAMQADREAARSQRFSRAIEHLKDESLHIRMGALYELQRLGLEAPREQKSITHILSRYIRDRIENPTCLHPSRIYANKHRPSEDVTLSCEVVAHFSTPNNWLKLHYLKASNVDFGGIPLQRAELKGANLYGAIFSSNNFLGTNFKEANLAGADFSNAKSLTVAQLLEANVDDTTLLDPDLRAEYERLKIGGPP